MILILNQMARVFKSNIGFILYLFALTWLPFEASLPLQTRVPFVSYRKTEISLG